MLKVLRDFRALIEAIRRLHIQIAQATEAYRDAAPGQARLEELERSRALWEANVEAILLKADSTLKAANNAESRARTMVKHYDKFADPLDPDFEEEPETVPVGHAPTGEEEGVQPVRVDVAPDYKALALSRKFG